MNPEFARLRREDAEYRAATETRALADVISRRMLAERAPMSKDPRADRLLYGIHDVERYLRASGT